MCTFGTQSIMSDGKKDMGRDRIFDVSPRGSDTGSPVPQDSRVPRCLRLWADRGLSEDGEASPSVRFHSTEETDYGLDSQAVAGYWRSGVPRTPPPGADEGSSLACAEVLHEVRDPSPGLSPVLGVSDMARACTRSPYGPCDCGHCSDIWSPPPLRRTGAAVASSLLSPSEGVLVGLSAGEEFKNSFRLDPWTQWRRQVYSRIEHERHPGDVAAILQGQLNMVARLLWSEDCDLGQLSTEIAILGLSLSTWRQHPAFSGTQGITRELQCIVCDLHVCVIDGVCSGRDWIALLSQFSGAAAQILSDDTFRQRFSTLSLGGRGSPGSAGSCP